MGDQVLSFLLIAFSAYSFLSMSASKKRMDKATREYELECRRLEISRMTADRLFHTYIDIISKHMPSQDTYTPPPVNRVSRKVRIKEKLNSLAKSTDNKHEAALAKKIAKGIK